MLAYELDPEQIRHLEPDDFFAADNREIFRVIAEAIESGVDSIPSLAVVDRLRQSGALQAAGGAENVDRIVEEQMVPKAGIEEAADVVRRLSQLRQLITTAREIIETAQDKSVDLDNAVERENAVLAIRERRSGENPMRSMVTISKNLAERMAKGDWGTDRGLRTGFERLDHQLGGFARGM